LTPRATRIFRARLAMTAARSGSGCVGISLQIRASYFASPAAARSQNRACFVTCARHGMGRPLARRGQDGHGSSGKGMRHSVTVKVATVPQYKYVLAKSPPMSSCRVNAAEKAGGQSRPPASSGAWPSSLKGGPNGNWET
jgi:hypothetical protein